MTSYAGRWWQFTRERFDPVSHLVMIAVFLAAHFVVYGDVHPMNWVRFGILFAATVAFFFKLRLYDEIKDYEVDLIKNPTRPLARGLLRQQDLKIGIVLCILVELALFSGFGSKALTAVGIAILYSLLMYREFFVPSLIRPHLTTYAVSHTVVSGIFSLALLSALTGQFPWAMGKTALFFGLNSWALFNIFEFGRKTFETTEEREGVESYSKVFGRIGAVILVLAMALASVFLLTETDIGGNGQFRLFLSAMVVILALAGGAYAFLNRAPLGKFYRAFSSFYIVLIYLGVVVVGALAP